VTRVKPLSLKNGGGAKRDIDRRRPHTERMTPPKRKRRLILGTVMRVARGNRKQAGLGGCLVWGGGKCFSKIRVHRDHHITGKTS